ncbi:Hypothetical predicted protein [Olea europaea subsp. europaea]|uniref:DUF7950 domain-containing protein n=1 Tax=Olea europaea subsp. europaea TaxID=158383 RepID=A0A8S0U232_OLEEU|nr:Hypothetical predicted protein [Olea europaea subsp. europaea]
MGGGKTWSAVGFSGGGAYDTTIINRIMLRYRPIAPKPVSDGSVSGSTVAEIKSGVGNKRRTKRKYVRVKKTARRCNSSKMLNKSEDRKDLDINRSDVTLQLLPEMTALRDSKATGSSTNMDFPVEKPPILINFDNSENNCGGAYTVSLPERSDLTEVVPAKRVVESWIMVDKITNAWVDGRGLGCTDTEKKKNLEMDTCPGLISDGLNRVQWVNCAYRRMVAPPERGDPPAETAVWLVVNEKISVPWQAFACTVRVVYTWRKERHSQTMPCDVWKMEFGGFAWRLDANAALSLGR